MSLYDMIFSRREGGDPTKVTVPVEARTYGNPGFRERGGPVSSKYSYRSGFQRNGLLNFTFATKISEIFLQACRFAEGGISMTDASGKPYSAATNGSTASMHTTSTILGSNGSTVDSSVTKSPLRSSLKKPKPKDGLGIQNPGFSGSSPTFSRNGSMKKVRIQTHSTEV